MARTGGDHSNDSEPRGGWAPPHPDDAWDAWPAPADPALPRFHPPNAGGLESLGVAGPTTEPIAPAVSPAMAHATAGPRVRRLPILAGALAGAALSAALAVAVVAWDGSGSTSASPGVVEPLPALSAPAGLTPAPATA